MLLVFRGFRLQLWITMSFSQITIKLECNSLIKHIEIFVKRKNAVSLVACYLF